MRALLLAVLLAPLGGCYSLGFSPVAGISEVAVPIFANDTLRRELDYDLTRHVRREVLEATPLHLAREGSAETILRGRLTRVTESVLVSGAAEEVLAAGISVSVVFGVYRDGELLVGEDSDGDGRPDREILVKGYSEFDAARGQSRESATSEALRDAAELVVFRLEARDDDRYESNDDVSEARTLSPGQESSLIQRNPDCFRVQLGARHALKATIYFSASADANDADEDAEETKSSALHMRALDGAGENAGKPLADTATRDEGRILTLLAGEAPRDVVLEITGDDTGTQYQLLTEVLDDDIHEPDSVPSQAFTLPGGQRRWSVRRLLRDDDYFAISVPVGHALRASVAFGEGESTEPAEGIELRATDALGAREASAAHADDGRSVVVPKSDASKRILLRVSGSTEGQLYRLNVSLDAQ
jgi:hypothetical protein